MHCDFYFEMFQASHGLGFIWFFFENSCIAMQNQTTYIPYFLSFLNVMRIRRQAISVCAFSVRFLSGMRHALKTLGCVAAKYRNPIKVKINSVIHRWEIFDENTF